MGELTQDLQHLYCQAKEKEHQKAIGLGRGSKKSNGKVEEHEEKVEEVKKECEQRPILKQPGGQQRHQCEVSASETDSQREPGVTFQQPAETALYHKEGSGATERTERTNNGKLGGGGGGGGSWELQDIKVGARVRPPVPIRQDTTICSAADRKTDSLLRQVEARTIHTMAGRDHTDNELGLNSFSLSEYPGLERPSPASQGQEMEGPTV